MTNPSGDQKPKRSRIRRVLAIDPTHCGFGFAVLEGPDRLLDWGIVSNKTHSKKQRYSKIAHLIDQYTPDGIVAEDVNSCFSRRGHNATALIGVASQLAGRYALTFECFPRFRIRELLAAGDATLTRHQTALLVAEHFSQLRSVLPRVRKPWMSEDLRMSLFRAAACALVYGSRVSRRIR